MCSVQVNVYLTIVTQNTTSLSLLAGTTVVSFLGLKLSSWEKRTDSFTFIVSLLSHGRNIFVSLPRGAVGWFVVCDCDIS